MRKNRTIISLLIILLTIITLIILFFIFRLLNLKNTKDENDIATNTKISDINNTSTNSNTTEEIDYENSDYIFYHEGETGNVKYSREHLDKFEFSINGISDDVLNYIEDVEEFNIEIKEYIYLNGLVKNTSCELTKYEIRENENRIGFLFKLDKDDKIQLLVILDLEDDSLEITEYKQ